MRMNLFPGSNEEDKSEEIPCEECDTQTVERTHTLEFERVTQMFQFVRGSTQTLVWDDWNDPIRNQTGRREEKRGEFMIEQFDQIVGGSSIGSYNGEMVITPELEQVGEVTTANVAYRKEEQRTPMVLEAICQHKQYTHPETGNVVKTERFPKLDARTFNIREKE